MVAPPDTIEKLAIVMLRHLSPIRAEAIMAEITAHTVPSGNQSYDETVWHLHERLKRELV